MAFFGCASNPSNGASSGSTGGSIGGSGSSGGGGPSSLNDFVTGLAQAQCGQWDKCVFLSAHYKAQCPSMLAAQYASLVDDVSSDLTRFDASLAADCIVAVEASDCNGWFALALGQLPNACRGLFTGTLDAGAPCYGASQCAVGGCEYVNGVCPGTCKPFVEVGESCPDVGATPTRTSGVQPTASVCRSPPRPWAALATF